VTDNTVADIPGFVAGTWEIDPIRSEVTFLVRNFTLRKQYGRFDRVTGTIVTDEDYHCSSVSTTIDTGTIRTSGHTSDRHVRSERFLDVESFPNITFKSTAIHPDSATFYVVGDLAIRGTTRSVVLKLDVEAFTSEFVGGTRAHFNATTAVSRKAFGVRPKGVLGLADNALILSDTVGVTLRIEAALRSRGEDGSPTHGHHLPSSP
jgi:polyisoprenoid-binding protein YceI